jgi:ketosteroid isomerase-like protein
MASANLDLVRSICAAWERGDWSSAEWAHPEIEYVIADGPSPGSWKGLAGMAEGWREFLSSWEEFHGVVDDYLELDSERVLVLLSATARAKTSGIELGHLHPKSANVFHIHNGKVTRLAVYLDRERAFADVGLVSEAG